MTCGSKTAASADSSLGDSAMDSPGIAYKEDGSPAGSGFGSVDAGEAGEAPGARSRYFASDSPGRSTISKFSAVSDGGSYGRMVGADERGEAYFDGGKSPLRLGRRSRPPRQRPPRRRP